MNTPSQQILRLAFGFAVAQSLRVAAELGIADLLAKGERSADELSQATHTNADALYRVMRLLASEGVFREVSPRRFAQTELSATLRSDLPSSPRDFVRMINSEPFQAFAELLYSVRTGKPSIDKVFGAPRFQWLGSHPEQAALFQHAMIAFSQGSNEAVADAYDFKSSHCVVDVGGGHGQLLSAVLTRNPHLSGILFDLPSGIAAARTGAGGPLPRSELVAGNFFENVPAADTYIMKKVIHDWDDERASIILRNCRKAMSANGKVLIAETIMPVGNDPDPIKVLDLNMLAVPGGMERTETQFANLLSQSGLRLEQLIPTKAPISILEARIA